MDSFKLKNQRVKYDFPVGYVQEYLTVTSEAYRVRKSSKSSFRCVDCLCRCGNVTQVSLSRLGSGKAKSCGCLSRAVMESNISKYEAGFRAVLRVYKYSAKERCFDFSLSRETFEKLTTSNCVYCGTTPCQFQTRFSDFKYNGIDRVDNTLGYTEDNCVTCCKICNRMKDTLTVEDFKEHIKTILNFQRSKSFA